MKTINNIKMKNTELNQTLRYIYKKYNNTELSNEVLDNFNNTPVKEEPKKRVFVEPVYLKPNGVCSNTVNVKYKDSEFVVLRSSLSEYHQTKLPVGRWGNMNVKLSTLKIK